jgi:hypothetical protein
MGNWWKEDRRGRRKEKSKHKEKCAILKSLITNSDPCPYLGMEESSLTYFQKLISKL